MATDGVNSCSINDVVVFVSVFFFRYFTDCAIYRKRKKKFQKKGKEKLVCKMKKTHDVVYFIVPVTN